MTKPDAAAYPLDPEHYYDSEWGLSKREYFAAKMLQGLLGNDLDMGSIDEAAKCAIECTDALIKELNMPKAGTNE